MDRDRWEHLQHLLDAALQREGAARAVYLDRTSLDPDLRRELEALIAAVESEGPFDRIAEAWGLPPADGPSERLRPGTMIGPYRIVREIGRGGMGVVYLAERADGAFEQAVALKVVPGGGELRRRFLTERQLLARLEHPHVARLLNGGITPDGTPYFAMEFVDGEPITTYCDRHALAIDERLALFERVCDAVAYAHRNLVVHRDLKPSNILVTENEHGAPCVKLLDFGIAKLLAPDEERPNDLITRTGRRWMTPSHAAPEQVRGEPVTTATDVYALGVLLYELLTGHHPYRTVGLLPHEMERAVLEETPRRPSTVLRSREASPDAPSPEGVSAARRTRPERLRRRLAGDLDMIVVKALAKEPAHRYASAEGLLDDLQRHQTGLPVRARPASVGYRARTFVRRHRLGVTAAALLLFTLLGGLTATAWQAQRATRQARIAEVERDRARLEGTKAVQIAGFLESLFQSADPATARGDTFTARQLLDEGAARIEAELAEQPAVQAAMMDVMGRAYAGLGLYEPAERLLRQALADRRRLYGLPHPELSASLHHLGALLSDIGAYAEAESLLREAERVARSLPDTPIPASLFYDLALLVHRRGDLAESDSLFQHAADLYRHSAGAGTPEAAASITTLAQVRYAQRRYAEAILLFDESLAIRRSLYAGDHPRIAANLTEKARALREQGDLAEAEDVARAGLAMWRRVHPEGHVEVAVSAQGLGKLLTLRRRYEEAEPLLREALTTMYDKLGGDHPSSITPAYDLADVLRERGRLYEAERLQRNALALSRQRFGSTHSFVVAGQIGLARILTARGRPHAAERTYRAALATAQETLRERHPLRAQGEAGLAALLREHARCAEAEPLYRSALAARLEALPANHPTVAGLHSELGACLLALSQVEAATPLLQRGYEDLRRRLGTEDPATEAARQRLDALHGWGATLGG